MTDNRITTFAGQVQTEFLDSFQSNPLPVTPLKACAKSLPSTDNSNTFREYILPYRAGTVTDLTSWRALGSATNPLTSNATHGGQIASTARPNKYMDHTINTVYYDAFDVDGTTGIDGKHNSPEAAASRMRKTFDQALMQFEHEQCALQALSSNQWIVPAAATTVLSTAIAASDTTFELTDAIKASSGIAAGDLVKIGDKRTPNYDDGVTEYMDVVLIKTVGGNGSGGGTESTITIETDIDDIPPSLTLDGRIFKDGCDVVLTAHDADVAVQIDRPTAITEANIDNVLANFRTYAQRAYIAGKKFVLYMAPEVFEVVVGTTTGGVRSPMVANDFLGKGILTTGEVYEYRGMILMSDANAISREYAGGASGTTNSLAAIRHYIWAFEKGETFGYGKLLQGSSMDKLEGRAGLLYKFSYAEVSGSTMLYNGSIKSFLMPVTV